MSQLQYDFDLLGNWKSSAVQNLDILLEKLSKLFKRDNVTEADKLSLLIEAEKALIPNKILSSCKIITTCKVCKIFVCTYYTLNKIQVLLISLTVINK